jgi:hypothetical protein
MKHARPFNRKAKALAQKNDPEVIGLACGVCCSSFAPGWEVGSGGAVDPCPWQNDLHLCYVTCFWTVSLPDDNSFPAWENTCGNFSNDWMNLCVVPD